jgi:O-antigen ligase
MNFKTTLFFLYIIIIPILVGISFTSEEGEKQLYSRLIFLICLMNIPFIIIKGFSNSLQIPGLLGVKAFRWGAIFFLILFTVTYFSDAVEIRTSFEIHQMRSVISLFAWCLPAISIYFLVDSRADFLLVIKLVLIGFFLISVSVYLALILNFLGIEFGEVMHKAVGPGRYFGPLGDQVGFISATAGIIAIVYRRFLESTFHLGAVLATGTRGALIVFLLGVVLWLYHEIFSKKEKICILSPIGDILFARVFEQKFLEIGYSIRLTSFKLAAAVFLENPFFGVGGGNFFFSAYDMRGDLLFDKFFENYLSTTSNQLLQVLVETGIIGAVFFILMIVYSLLTIRERYYRDIDSKKYAQAILIVGLANVLANQAAVWFLVYSITYLFISILVCAAIKLRYLEERQLAGNFEKYPIISLVNVIDEKNLAAIAHPKKCATFRRSKFMRANHMLSKDV